MEKQRNPSQYFLVRPESKAEVLKQVVRRHHTSLPTMVVCRSALDAVQTAVALLEEGFMARAFCGHMPSGMKERLKKQVFQGRIEVLIVTFASLEEAEKWTLMPRIYHDVDSKILSGGLALITADEWHSLRKDESFRANWKPGIGGALTGVAKRAGYRLRLN